MPERDITEIKAAAGRGAAEISASERIGMEAGSALRNEVWRKVNRMPDKANGAKRHRQKGNGET